MGWDICLEGVQVVCDTTHSTTRTFRGSSPCQLPDWPIMAWTGFSFPLMLESQSGRMAFMGSTAAALLAGMKVAARDTATRIAATKT